MPRVVIQDGPRAGKEHELGRETTVGNAGMNDIVVQGADVADIQARFVEVGDTYYIENSAGHNGLTINGKPVDARKELKSGDKIVIGGVTLLFNPFEAETRAGLRQLMDAGPKQRPVLGVVLPLLAAVIFLEGLWAVKDEKAALIGGILAALLLIGYLVNVAYDRKR